MYEALRKENTEVKRTIKFSRANKSYKPIQAAGFDAEAFKARHKAAQERSAAKKEERRNRIIMEIESSDDPIETAFELLVPGSGKADTVAGELVRAMMRILYRDYNDGDRFYEGYGIETCGDAVAFICDKIPDLEDKFEDIAMRNLTEERYTQAIKAISEDLLDEIYADPDLVTTKNDEDMFSYDGERFIKEREWEPRYDFECDIPDNVYAHLEAGNISTTDLQWEVEGWDVVRNGDVRVSRDYISVNDIDRDTYDELEENMYTWLDDYGDQLDEEYGVPNEDDEEEEE